MMSHADARAVIRAALQRQGVELDPVVVQAFQAQGWLESGYGGSRAKNNWGSVQCGHGPPCKAGCAELTDHHADGSAYQWCYKAYPTPTDGAADMIANVLKRPWMLQAMESGDATAIEAGLRRRDPPLYAYLEGPHNYALGLEKRAEVIGEALSEPVYVVRGGGKRPAGLKPSGKSGSGAGAAAVAVVAALLAARLIR